MILPVVKYGAKVLETPTRPVEEFDEELEKLCADMFESMYAAQGVGLAAPQIGLDKRLAVVDVTGGKNPEAKLVLANPEIVHSEGEQREDEGCLSVPGFRGHVLRPLYVTMRAQDVTGQSYEMRGEGLLARAFCHEIDHLNGTLFLQHLSLLKRDLIKRRIRKRWINLHGSLLPKYRGAAPIHWAVANGETRTGLTTMQIDAGLDTGPTLLKQETRIGLDETSPELYERLAEAGAPLMVETLRGLENGSLSATPQDNSLATLAPPLKKEDGKIDWSFAAQKIYDRMRGFKPWPGTFSSFREKAMPIVGKTGRGGGLGRERAGVERRRAGIVICGGTPAFRGVRRGNRFGDRVDPNRRKKTHGHSRFFEWGAPEERRTIRRVSSLLIL
jgi:peptide deformylase